MLAVGRVGCSDPGANAGVFGGPCHVRPTAGGCRGCRWSSQRGDAARRGDGAGGGVVLGRPLAGAHHGSGPARQPDARACLLGVPGPRALRLRVVVDGTRPRPLAHGPTSSAVRERPPSPHRGTVWRVRASLNIQAAVDYRNATSRWRVLPGPCQEPRSAGAVPSLSSAFQLAVSAPRRTASVLCAGGPSSSSTILTLDLDEDEDEDEDGGNGDSDGVGGMDADALADGADADSDAMDAS